MTKPHRNTCLVVALVAIILFAWAVSTLWFAYPPLSSAALDINAMVLVFLWAMGPAIWFAVEATIWKSDIGLAAKQQYARDFWIGAGAIVLLLAANQLGGAQAASPRHYSEIEKLTTERESLGHQSEQRRGSEQRLAAGLSPSWFGRMKQLMFGLFYPAILGALLYDILLAGKRANWIRRLGASDRKLLIAGLLVLHFVVDFIFTQEVGGYKASVFGLDIAIVVLLFIAYDGVHLNDSDAPLDVERISISLCGTYLCFLLWEYLLRAELGFHLELFIYELTALILFLLLFLVAKFFGLNSKWLAWLLAAATIAMGVIGSRILEKYHAASTAI